MKNNLMIYKYKTKPVNGTFSTNEIKNFFGSKMIDIEDDIIINDESIQFSDFNFIYNNINDLYNLNSNGYQNFNYDSNLETIQLKNLTDLKKSNHTIKLQAQSDLDLRNNTKWIINIDCKNILKNYLFYRLKEHRVFKCIQYNELYNSNVNNFILDYIELNLLNRYKFNKINIYIQYIDIINNVDYNISKINYNPTFNKNIVSVDNLEKNANVQQINSILSFTDMQVLYNQTKKSTEYTFDYYFDLLFTKI